MFMSKDTLAKIALGSMITSVMTFATLMPVSAHELQPNADRNASMSMQGGVQEGLLPLSNLGLLDKAAAQIIPLMDGKSREMLVMPRDNLRELAAIGQNGLPEAAVSASQKQEVDGQVAASENDEQTVDNETPAPADQGQTVDRLYAKLLTSYDKLLSIYDHLLSYFGTAFTH